MECNYPDLFSTASMMCTNFQNVQCRNRPEPQAPCDYSKNKCDGKSSACEPCLDRYPSCVGTSDGKNKIPQKEWTSQYIVCYRNRTLDHRSCDVGIFHPLQRKCITTLHPGESEVYCRGSPRRVIGSSVNAAQYFDCLSKDSTYGKYIQECKYPDLFSTKTGKCENFRVVPKDSRPIPQAPCEYTQNHCPILNENCSPCEERHHSCIGLPDGNNPVSDQNWTPYYISCLMNRTISENKCTKGLFDPVKKTCVLDGYFGQIEVQCVNNPSALYKHPENCALYYNCSTEESVLGQYVNECRYPQLYSTLTHRCEDYTDVDCRFRHEPQSPCEYLQNGCRKNDPGCVPCPLRLPSCIGLMDGDNPVTESIWSNAFVKCHKNRTVGKTECSYGYFDPTKKMCVDMLHPDDAAQFCKTNPYSTIRSSVNCAQYIDCSLPAPFISECEYPNLFSPATMMCRDFRMVECGSIYEPKSPCEYKHNECKEGNTCTVCPDTMPSCVGLPNGYNAYPRREWSEHYIVCHKNRTMDIRTCDEGIFHPNQRRCVKGLDNGSIQDYCAVHKNIRIHNADNCAQFYDCSSMNSIYGPYLHECVYPQLYSVAHQRCEDFQTIHCGSRPEPMAPCQYIANACPSSAAHCSSCVSRLPSCINLSDGDHPFTEGRQTSKYITCYKNRTQAVNTCPEGVFDESVGKCAVKPQSNVNIVCRTSPSTLVPDPSNCARFYNCSEGSNPVVEECEYPSLFSAERQSCMDFKFVECANRFEPKAPCDYNQYICKPDQEVCVPCPERHPSCVGLTDGYHPYPGKEWSSRFFVCDRERTVREGTCTDAIFNYKIGDCVSDISKDDISEFCTANPTSVVPYAHNCAQYFNCSHYLQSPNNVLKECDYPKLFNRETLTCDDFWHVNCDVRYEPMGPCEYKNNMCKDMFCESCEEKFTSCVGKPNGPNKIPGSDITSDFVICEQNRTITMDTCSGSRVFDPNLRMCVPLSEDTINQMCSAYPNKVQPHPYNCGQFIDCSRSRPGVEIGIYTKECEYPNLFSSRTYECMEFSKVNCSFRHEPRAPCEYKQNVCKEDEIDCKPCSKRFPSCIGLPDGTNPIKDTEWSDRYVTCYKNRTVKINQCNSGLYNPYQKTCTEGDVPHFCLLHPTGKMPNPLNCAQYYDCSTKETEYGNYLHECPYPALYDEKTRSCHHYSTVQCGNRFEPKAPCDYIAHKCAGSHCKPCVERYPSCVGLSDGHNGFPNRGVTSLYIVCEGNRMISIEKCPETQYNDVYDPYLRHCTSHVNSETLNAYCKINKGLMIPSPDNCARYYDCSDNSSQGSLKECPYPKLFSEESQDCLENKQVNCGTRKNPHTQCRFPPPFCRN